MRILFLSRWFPYPPNNGSKIRIHNILKWLSREHDVSLLAFAEESDRVDAASIEALRGFCRRVQAIPYCPFRPSRPGAMLGLLGSMPRYLTDSHSREMERAVLEEVDGGKVDLVIASQWPMVPYAMLVPGVPALLEELELAGFVDELNGAGSWRRRGRSLLTWLKMKRYLEEVLPRFAACTVVSERERRIVAKLVPDSTTIEIIPNALDLSCYVDDFGAPTPSSLIYPGAITYDANYDAVRYFLSEIYPRVVDVVPGARFRVTGTTKGVDMATLPQQPGVTFTGHLDDVRPAIARSWAAVVPLRVGGGTRLKILESMALGTPVVATSKGAEGLEVTDGEDILIADDSLEFADRVIILLGSRDLRRRLARSGRDLVKREYNWDVVGARLDGLATEVAAALPGASLVGSHTS